MNSNYLVWKKRFQDQSVDDMRNRQKEVFDSGYKVGQSLEIQLISYELSEDITKQCPYQFPEEIEAWEAGLFCGYKSTGKIVDTESILEKPLTIKDINELFK